MDSQKSSSATLFLLTNLLFFVLVSGCKNPPNSPVSKPSPITNPDPSPPREGTLPPVCAKLLGQNIGTIVGNPLNTPCCSILGGLLDLEAAVCLCTALKANVLGININIPIALSLLINTCGKTPPKDFICA
ncbi:UNVERIFIED_CONTAM: proline-rich protein DC2.15 [Sesamum radiatum]|uniref:Proline-rich protein DC2.15 n=1 Tax=Sesamum radiatum TaxID=300843 RepID=A0AAW2L1Y6_SESRA